MKKFWLVFKHEYLRHVLTKRFIFGILSVPFFVALSIGLGLLSVILGTDKRPVGIIDHSGVLAAPVIYPEKNDGPIPFTTFLFFTDAKQSQAALDNREIQGYYVLEPDYLTTGKIALTATEPL
ncbi:MAG: hypothetical protein ACYDHA_11700, partial [Bellilinea sp.]